MKTITTKELLANYIANTDKEILAARIAALLTEASLLQLANPVVIKINKVLPNFIEVFKGISRSNARCSRIIDVSLLPSAKVEVRYEATTTRYFRTEEESKRADSCYDGNSCIDDTHPYAAEVTYTSNDHLDLDRVIAGLEVEYI